MDIQVNPSVISVVLVAMAAASLLVMVSLNQINYLVHGDLYDYGLQFSYRWAMPYWVLSGLVFGLSWVNIFIAIAITLYVFTKSRRHTGLSGQFYRRAAAEDVPALVDDKAQRTICAFFDPALGTEPVEEAMDVPSAGLIPPPAAPPVAAAKAKTRGASKRRFGGRSDEASPSEPT